MIKMDAEIGLKHFHIRVSIVSDKSLGKGGSIFTMLVIVGGRGELKMGS